MHNFLSINLLIIFVMIIVYLIQKYEWNTYGSFNSNTVKKKKRKFRELLGWYELKSVKSILYKHPQT